MAEQKPKINTMKELSIAIGVSRPTLSRYFQDPTSIRPATSQKIKAGLETVDYVYNFLATRQNRKSTGLVGIIIPHFSDLFFTSLLEAIDNAARDAGLTVITQSSHGDEATEIAAVEKLRSMNVDGAIIAPLGMNRSNRVFEAASADFPIVFVDSIPSKPIDGTDFVGTNNAQSIAAMVEYLCDTGEAPLFLNMALNSNTIERKQAYADTMRRLGHEPTYVDFFDTPKNWDLESFGYTVMEKHFSQGRYSDATILCANDRIGIGAIRAANHYGLFSSDKQQKLRIAGHDNHPLSAYIYPSLTTVIQDVVGIGEEAINLLMDRMHRDRDRAHVELLKDGVLKIRQSA